MAKYKEEVQQIIATTIRANICEIGTKLLKEQGWGGFTTENIAKELGVSRSMLYNYFKDKEDIIRFILKNSIDNLMLVIDPIVFGDSSANNKIVKLTEILVQDFRTKRELHYTIRTNTTMPAFKKDGHKPLPLMLGEKYAIIIREGIKKGEFNECDADKAAFFLAGGVVGMCNHMLVINEPINVTEMLSVFLRGLKK